MHAMYSPWGMDDCSPSHRMRGPITACVRQVLRSSPLMAVKSRSMEGAALPV